MSRALTRLLFSLFAISTFAGFHTLVNAKFMSKAELHARQRESAARIKATLPRALDSKTGTGVKNITFSNPRASGESLLYQFVKSRTNKVCREEFYVDGTSIPDVNWDIGPSWSGLLPISSDPNETRKVCSYRRTWPACAVLQVLNLTAHIHPQTADLGTMRTISGIHLLSPRWKL